MTQSRRHVLHSLQQEGLSNGRGKRIFPGPYRTARLGKSVPPLKRSLLFNAGRQQFDSIYLGYMHVEIIEILVKHASNPGATNIAITHKTTT